MLAEPEPGESSFMLWHAAGRLDAHGTANTVQDGVGV